MDDEEILARGGDEEDIRKYAEENGATNPMSKLDELDKPMNANEAYQAGHGYLKCLHCDRYVHQLIAQARLEEREAMKNMIDRLPSATRSECDNEKVVCVSDLLSELNK